MLVEFLEKLSALSTIGELPTWSVTVDVAMPGRSLGALFEKDMRLPGVVIGDAGRPRGVISRGQYLRVVSRSFGHEVFDPRPIRLLFEAVEQMDEPLMLVATTPIQEAVALALQRPRALIYEPVIVELRGAVDPFRLIDFPDLLLADSRLSALRNRQMKQILSTVQEGFLLLDRDLVIGGEYSASIETIFATRHLAGRRFDGLLSDVLAPDQVELTIEYLRNLFNPNVMERWIAELNPLRKARAQVGACEKFLSFRFVRNLERGRIDRLLVRVEDISREVLLAEELEAQERKGRERIDLIFALLRVAPAELAGFMTALAQTRALAVALVDAGGPSGSRRDQLARTLHALKGEAGMLGLEPQRLALHRIEEHFTTPNEPEDQLRRVAADVELLAHETENVLEQLRTLGRVAATGNNGHANTPAAGSPAEQAAPAVALPVSNLFENLGRLVDEQAQRLGKQARFFANFAEHDLPEGLRILLKDVLIQLVLNAVVHGLEDPEERQRAGKGPMGTVQVGLKKYLESKQVQIIVQDDGRGLDLERIRGRAETLGLPIESEERLKLLIFEKGFSTASTVDLAAGRGIGLDLVKSAIAAAGGVIVPHFKKYAYCAFQIVLPL
jgi:two-component system, chemotaxis family, sensor kinase CheA